jgi:caspase-like apoptosis-related cysteine protease
MSVLAVSKEDHKNEDCIVVAVLTHGFGKSKLYAYDDYYRTDMLWSSFTGDVCPSLAGKPKLFIVQVSVQSMRLKNVVLWDIRA